MAKSKKAKSGAASSNSKKAAKKSKGKAQKFKAGTPSVRTVTKTITKRIGGGGSGAKFSLMAVAKAAGWGLGGWLTTIFATRFIPTPDRAKYDDKAKYERAMTINRALVIGGKAVVSGGGALAVYKATKSAFAGIAWGAGGMISVLLDLVNMGRAWWKSRRDKAPATTQSGARIVADAQATNKRMGVRGIEEAETISAGVEGIESAETITV